MDESPLFSQFLDALAALSPTFADALEVGHFTFADNPDLVREIAQSCPTIESFQQFKSFFDNSTSPQKPTKPNADEIHNFAKKSALPALDYRVWQRYQYRQQLKTFYHENKNYENAQNQRKHVKQNYSHDARGYARFVMATFPTTQQDFFLRKNTFSLSEAEREKHTYITGGTGSGKSELMKILIHHYLTKNQNTALVLIDPHGDIAEEVARFRENYKNPDRLAYFDFGLSDDHTPTFNPFDVAVKSTKHLDVLSQEITEAFAEMFKGNFSLQMNTILKHCLPPLFLKKGASMTDLKRFLSDDEDQSTEYIQFAMEHANNPEVAAFFRDDFHKDTYNPTKQSIKTKLQSLLAMQSFFQSLCGNKTFDLETLINQKKLIVFNLSVGDLGAEVSELMGRFILAQLKSIAFNRSRLPANKRVKTHVFIDECQRFLTPSIKTILTEARKYKVHLTMANQFYGQDMTAALKDAITSNTNIKITGRNSEKSLKTYAAETGTEKDELHNLRVGEFHVKQGSRSGVKMKAPEYLLKNKNAMKPEQWAEIKAQQLARYYRPIKTESVETPKPQHERTHDTPKSPTKLPMEL